MDITKRLGICGITSSRPLNSQTEKFDRFTNADQDGVMKSKVSGIAEFIQTFLPATVRSGKNPVTTYATIKAYTDAGITIVHDGTEYPITSLDISSVTDVTSMGMFCIYLQGKLRQVTSDNTIRVSFDGTDFIVTCDTKDISFVATDGVTDDLAFKLALANGTTVDDSKYPTVLPYRAVEGYTAAEGNAPADLDTFYQFRSNLKAKFGENLTVTDPTGVGEGTPAYTTIGNLNAINSADPVCFAQSAVTVPAGAFEFSGTFHIDTLPGAGEIQEIMLLSNSYDLGQVYGNVWVNEDGQLKFNFNSHSAASYVELTASGVTADSDHVFRCSFDGTTGLTLYMDDLDTPADNDTLGSTFDPSVITVLSLVTGGGDITGGGEMFALDGAVGNVGIFGSIQTTDYWNDIENGGDTKPLWYQSIGTVVTTFRDVPEYVSGLLVDVETPIYQSSDDVAVLKVNVFPKANTGGVEDQKPGYTIDLTPVSALTAQNAMDGCIITLTIDPDYGYVVVSGIATTFVE